MGATERQQSVGRVGLVEKRLEEGLVVIELGFEKQMSPWLQVLV